MLAVCIAAVEVFITLHGLNLLSSNEQIGDLLERMIEVASPRFEQMMNAVLPPALVGTRCASFSHRSVPGSPWRPGLAASPCVVRLAHRAETRT